jgi:cytochrome c biogenesis protein CcmG/thiol:disulfide interchange protein DsbE
MTDARTPRLGTWLGLAGIVLIAIAMVVVFSRGFGKDPSLIKSPLIGQPVPNDTLSYLEGEGTLNLADNQSNVMVVNFFASWCFPCRQEHSIISAAAAEYAGAPVEFVGIVYQDKPQSAIDFLDSFGRAEGMQYVVDPESRVAIDFGVFGVPETFFVAPDGTILAKKVGPISTFEITNTINTILAGATPGDLNEGQTQSG